MCMCVCRYVGIQACMPAQRRSTNAAVCICVYTHVHTHVCIYMYTRKHIHTYLPMQKIQDQQCSRNHIHTYIHTYIHAYIDMTHLIFFSQTKEQLEQELAESQASLSASQDECATKIKEIESLKGEYVCTLVYIYVYACMYESVSITRRLYSKN